jgi:uncharacterized protein (DUF2147 family)
MKYLLLLALSFQFSFSQSIFGKWKTIDDETGKERSIVLIYEVNGKVYGKVIEILEPTLKDKKCALCNGADKDKPVLGLTIIKGLSKDEEEYNGGKILDPKNGKLYKCSIILDGADKLKIRGYIGVSMFGRTQYWQRVK